MSNSEQVELCIKVGPPTTTNQGEQSTQWKD